MIFGKARLVFAGQEKNSVDKAVACIRKIPHAYLAAVCTDYKAAVSYAQKVGCDAAFFDCGYREGESLQKELYEADPDILVSFRDKSYINGFGWCGHDGEYEDRLQDIVNACWYDPYTLPVTFGYREILKRIDKRADAKALYNDLPQRVRQHSQRVAERTVAAMRFALEHGLLRDTEYVNDLYPACMDYLYEAALLHDVGKAFLPTWLVEKKTALSRAERVLYHMHVQFGDRLLTAYELPLMIDEHLSGEPLRRYMAQACASYHHELVGSIPLQIGHEAEDTPIWAQVCGIVNLWDNLLHEGLDGKNYTEQESIAWLDMHSGSLFTTEAYRIFKGYQAENV